MEPPSTGLTEVPWWSWIAIWGGLAVLLLAMLVLLAVILFRKGMRVFEALDELAGKTEILDRVGAVAEGQTVQLAILEGRVSVAKRRDQVRAAAEARKAARHDARIARAKALTRVDASTREWFTAD